MTKVLPAAVRLTLFAAALHARTTRESAAAEIPIQPVQSALKKQGFFEGEPTGQLDAATRGALRRFQTRAGLNATGEIDEATVKALKSGGPSAAETAIEPSIRERAREVVRSDQEFLEKVESLEQAEAPPSAPPGARPKPVTKPEPRVRRSAPEPVASAPEPARPEPTPPESRAPLPPEAVHQFVEGYLRASQGNTPDGEVALYADEVDYFDSGRVSRKAVEKDQRAYYRRWPSRKFALISEPTIERISDRGATVRFRIRYALHNGDESASGRTENVLRLKQTDEGLRIAAIRERKVTE